MPLSLQQIIGTITGKLAFERTQANFQEIQAAVNANETNIAGKLGTSHNADAAAHNDIRESINTLATQENWIVPNLLNGWVNSGGGSSIAGYYKDKFGIVRLRGILTGGTTTSGTTLFTLPAGYRPLYITAVPAITTSDGNTYNSKGYDIDTNGNVKLKGAFGAFLYLDGITFKAEQ